MLQLNIIDIGKIIIKAFGKNYDYVNDILTIKTRLMFVCLCSILYVRTNLRNQQLCIIVDNYA